MRAIVLADHGGPEVLRLEERPLLEPGAGEALVRVRAVAVNRLDVWVRANVGHAYSARLPLVPGYDVAGTVEALGPQCEAASVGVGSPVYVFYDYACRRCEFCLAGDESLCAQYELMGVDHDGGYADYVVAPPWNLFPLGAGTSFEDAAAAGSVFLTAYHMLFARAALRAGESVLVMAAGSGVGGAALQLSRYAGARVFATAGSHEKLARALADGAERAFDYTSPGWSSEALDATSGRGVDVIIDHSGSELFPEAVRALAPRGRLVICGASSGSRAELDLIDLFARQISIIGSSDGSRRELVEVLRLLDDGLIRPTIDSILPLDQAADAQERLSRRDHYGRILLRP